MIHKLGRRPARHTLRTMRSAIALDRALAALGTAPTVSKDYLTPLLNALSPTPSPPPGGGNGPIGMFLNDQLGDCVCADSCHQVMLHTANAGTIVIPTNDDCLQLYEAVGGYNPNAALVNGQNPTDTGCDETSMEEYMQSTGLAGQKSAGTVAIDPTNLNNLRWAVQLFGCVRLGIVVDSQMEQQFSSGEPWTTPADPNDPDAGGHDVPILGRYDADFAYAATWGGIVRITWSLLANPAFLGEAHASVWPDFITAAGVAPNGFSLEQLLADLPAISTAS
jgi:hypothetical protein